MIIVYVLVSILLVAVVIAALAFTQKNYISIKHIRTFNDIRNLRERNKTKENTFRKASNYKTFANVEKANTPWTALTSYLTHAVTKPFTKVDETSKTLKNNVINLEVGDIIVYTKFGFGDMFKWAHVGLVYSVSNLGLVRTLEMDGETIREHRRMIEARTDKKPFDFVIIKFTPYDKSAEELTSIKEKLKTVADKYNSKVRSKSPNAAIFPVLPHVPLQITKETPKKLWRDKWMYKGAFQKHRHIFKRSCKVRNYKDIKDTRDKQDPETLCSNLAIKIWQDTFETEEEIMKYLPLKGNHCRPFHLIHDLMDNQNWTIYGKIASPDVTVDPSLYLFDPPRNTEHHELSEI